MALAGLVAVAQALPLLAASLWRSVSSLIGRGASRRFTTRDSFARGRGDYAIVDEDEGELLGDESDEEVWVMICGGGDYLEIENFGGWTRTRPLCDIRFISAFIYI
jgi:hypothetical protein